MRPTPSDAHSPMGDTDIVAHVMRPAVTTVETDGHLAAAAYLINHAGQSALVVVDTANRPVALITEADLMRAIAEGVDAGTARVADWMTRNPRTISPRTTLTEAVLIMADSGDRHLPVVENGQLVGIVAISEIASELVHSVRLASAVVAVSDLDRSVLFYQPLLRFRVAAKTPDGALLTGPDGSQLYLHRVDRIRSHDDGGGGLEYVIWTAGSPSDLDRCAALLSEQNAYIGRTDQDEVAVVEGLDPDQLPVVITYPGPDQASSRFAATGSLARS